MYQFTTCGLNNVWLSNGYERHESPYGSTVAIAGLPGLFGTIAISLAIKSARLSGAEVRFLRKHMGLSPEALASVIGVDGHHVTRWETERDLLPLPEEMFLRYVALGFCDGDITVREGMEAIAIDETRWCGEPMVFQHGWRIWEKVA